MRVFTFISNLFPATWLAMFIYLFSLVVISILDSLFSISSHTLTCYQVINFAFLADIVIINVLLLSK